MRATIAHPVPVRWTPPRARQDRIAFERAVSVVEIPEVPPRELARQDRGYSLREGWTRFYVHDGRCFERVTAGMLGLGLPDGSTRVPHVDEVLDHLAGRGGGTLGLSCPGTPLFALLNGHARTGHRGEPLPDAVHARAQADNTAAARKALEAYVRGCIVTDGNEFYVARSMPVLHLSAWRTGYILDRHPPGIGDGVGFEPSRFDRVDAVTGDMAKFYRRGEVITRINASILNLRTAFGGIPYAGDDLAAFRNDGPEAVSRLIARARERKVPEAALAGAAACERRLRPYADLGRIGAIPEADAPLVEDLVCTGLLALDAALPEGDEMLVLKGLVAYARRVVMPIRAMAPLPVGDAEALDGLAPAP